MNNFWHDLPQPFFILAPMEAVTDVVFRQVIAAAAPPDVYFTEFTNATGWRHAGDKAIGGRLIKTDDESPLVAQLWGADPVAMAALSTHCRELGFHGIDLNMGCPDASATKSGSGAGMIRQPELAGRMIAAAKTVGLPVSVKTRLGYTYIDEWRDWLAFLLRQDIANLTIHLRTKREMSKVPAHFELIDDIVALRDELAPQTLLTINGDITDREHGLQLAAKHGIDGIMIGRGVFHNPFCFAKAEDNAITSGQSSASSCPSVSEGSAFPAERDQDHSSWRSRVPEEIDGHEISEAETKKQRLLSLLKLHLDLYDRHHEQTGRPYDTLKRFFKIYIRDFDGAAEMRDRLMHTKSTGEVRDIIA